MNNSNQKIGAILVVLALAGCGGGGGGSSAPSQGAAPPAPVVPPAPAPVVAAADPIAGFIASHKGVSVTPPAPQTPAEIQSTFQAAIGQ